MPPVYAGPIAAAEVCIRPSTCESSLGIAPKPWQPRTNVCVIGQPGGTDHGESGPVGANQLGPAVQRWKKLFQQPARNSRPLVSPHFVVFDIGYPASSSNRANADRGPLSGVAGRDPWCSATIRHPLDRDRRRILPLRAISAARTLDVFGLGLPDACWKRCTAATRKSCLRDSRARSEAPDKAFPAGPHSRQPHRESHSSSNGQRKNSLRSPVSSVRKILTAWKPLTIPLTIDES